jgi:hypothetical protein
MLLPLLQNNLLTGAGSVNGNATGALASVALSAPLGTGAGTALATGALDALALAAPLAAASGTALGAGVLDAVALSAPLGGATGTVGSQNGSATAALPGVALAAPGASAAGTSTVIDVKVSWLAFDTDAQPEAAPEVGTPPRAASGARGGASMSYSEFMEKMQRQAQASGHAQQVHDEARAERMRRQRKQHRIAALALQVLE